MDFAHRRSNIYKEDKEFNHIQQNKLKDKDHEKRQNKIYDDNEKNNQKERLKNYKNLNNNVGIEKGEILPSISNINNINISNSGSFVDNRNSFLENRNSNKGSFVENKGSFHENKETKNSGDFSPSPQKTDRVRNNNHSSPSKNNSNTDD